MSFYDTLRCAWYDPAFLVRHHADDLATLAFVGAMALVWAAL